MLSKSPRFTRIFWNLPFLMFGDRIAEESEKRRGGGRRISPLKFVLGSRRIESSFRRIIPVLFHFPLFPGYPPSRFGIHSASRMLLDTTVSIFFSFFFNGDRDKIRANTSRKFVGAWWRTYKEE